MYNEIASGYNELHGEEQRKKNRIIKELLTELKIPQGTVIDVGCGTGIGSEGIGKKKIGIDPSELRKQCPFETIEGVAENLPFKDKSFDLAICVTAIHNVDYKKAVKEMARVAEYAVITVLKKSRYASEIETLIKEHFIVLKAVEEDKDNIFILKAKEAV